MKVETNNKNSQIIISSNLGAQGLSAYEVAVKNGFIGTEQEWLDSLGGTGTGTGTAGQDGQDGQDGANGQDGESAYQIALNNGFVGTEQEWLASLIGADGQDGAQGEAGETGEKGDIGNTAMASTPFNPYKTITSTNGQDALEELKDEIDLKVNTHQNSPIIPSIWLGLQADYDNEFPNGTPNNTIAFIPDAVNNLTTSDITDFQTSVSNNSSVVDNINDITVIKENQNTQNNAIALNSLKVSADFFEVIQIACSDLVTDITTGVNKAYFMMPYNANLTGVYVTLLESGTGAGITIDINKDGTSILSTKLTTDALEDDSSNATTPVVISDNVLSERSKITIDIDAVGTNQKGAIVELHLTRI